MAYKLNNTFGTLLVTLPDGTIDTATTDLALFGKGYAGFGERLNENLIKLLENFNSTSSPANKQQGQMWYDKTNNQIKVWNGSKWKPVGSPTNSASQPTNANTGDMWFDTANTQLYVYTGTAWTLIGPTSVAGSGVTQVVAETILDNAGVNKSILKLVTNDSVVAVVSAEAFTPSSTDTAGSALISSGFASVAQGIQLSSSVAAAKFRGTATNAEQLGGIAAANYLQKNSDDTTSGALSVLSDNGITLGGGSDVKMFMEGDNFIIHNQTINKNIVLRVNDGGVDTDVLTINGINSHSTFSNNVIIDGNLTVNGTQTIHNTETLTVEDNIIELNRNVSSAAGMPNYTGLKVNRGEASNATENALYWVWDETFADDGTTIYGGAGGAWTAFRSPDTQTEFETAPTLVDIRANVVHATSTSAQYADLAERYEADCELEVGDVVKLGGHAEITKCDKEFDDAVFGVVSESPAFLMNAQAGNNDTHPMIALKGRVLVKIKGKGKAGDRIVSAEGGEAKVANLDECTAFNTLGRLIKHKYNVETTLTECVIGVK